MNTDEMIAKDLLKKIADIDGTPKGAFNIRQDGKSVERFSTANVQIKARKDGKPGIDVIVKPGTKGESVHIPVILTQTGMGELVYNDFLIGEGAEVDIVAGCAIHNCGAEKSQHDGIHIFHIGKNAVMRYSEKHYGEGDGSGERVLNPVTEFYLAEGALCETELTQIEGVSSTLRTTTAHLGKNARLVVIEKLLTHENQTATSKMDVYLNESGSTARIVSRSVAKGKSKQEFFPNAIGNADCRAHIQCDSIIMDDAIVRSVPAIEANCRDAQIVHEAAIGRINNEQMIKLETLGLDEAAAEQVIIDAFLE